MFSDLLICVNAYESENHKCNKSGNINEFRKIFFKVDLAESSLLGWISVKVRFQGPLVSGLVQTNALSIENAYISMRLGLLSKLIQ